MNRLDSKLNYGQSDNIGHWPFSTRLSRSDIVRFPGCISCMLVASHVCLRIQL